MMEKAKTLLLVMLVTLSLIQSYILAYSMPGLGATVKTDQDYVKLDPLGKKTSVENVIFPEEIVIHFGGNEHTVLYPGTTFYNMILKDRIQGREFKGFQRNPANMLNWDEVRKNDIGVELRFQNGIPVELLKKLLKVQGDLLFLGEMIDRIWIFKATDSEEVRTFFFSSDGQKVYESTQADLTVRDVQDYVGFGEYQPKYQMTTDGIYLPKQPIQSVQMVFPYELYSSELMQQMYFDPATTKALYDRSGSQIFTDGKRGLQIEQKGMWMIYTNPAASQSEENLLSENVFSSIEFINDHGGWDGIHRFINPGMNVESKTGKYAEFQQYVDNLPIIETKDFQYGSIRLTLQQGVVTEYSRSLITLAEKSKSREARWLPGGAQLRNTLDHYDRRSEVVRLFPALKAVPLENNELKFIPVWAVQLEDGTQEVLTEAYPVGFVPQEAKNLTGLGNTPDTGKETGTGEVDSKDQETASKDNDSNSLFEGSNQLQDSIAPDKGSKE
jgi:regulatory protein YycH of two-component signal transduction system YycFG